MEKGIGERMDGDLRWVFDLLISVLFEGAGAQLYALRERESSLDNVMF